MVHLRMAECPLCQKTGHPFYKDIYFACGGCKGIFMGKTRLPAWEDEKKRYETHNNDVSDPGYRAFVSPITNAVRKDFPPQSRGLDFGAGPGPVIAAVLGEAGYALRLYDPFFHDDPEALRQTYDYIVCCEVMEHFHDPAREFRLLRNLLNPGGRLYCMTYLYSPDIDFEKWFYKNDITHVFFYQNETLEWIRREFGFSALAVEGRMIVFDF
jgi:SAM-dependent methyltransferase